MLCQCCCPSKLAAYSGPKLLGRLKLGLGLQFSHLEIGNLDPGQCQECNSAGGGFPEGSVKLLTHEETGCLSGRKKKPAHWPRVCKIHNVGHDPKVHIPYSC